MKNFILLTLLMGFLVCPCANAQNQRIFVSLEDGTELEGWGKFKGRTKVKFWKTKDSDPEVFNIFQVARVKIFEQGEYRFYSKIQRKGSDDPFYAQEMVDGKARLYRTLFESLNPGGTGSPISNQMATYQDYYVIRDGEEKTTAIAGMGGIRPPFKRGAMEYFKDCPTLVEHIKKRRFKKKDIVEIVKYYNEKCGETE